MANTDSKAVNRYELNSIRAMLVRAGITDQDSLVDMVKELVGIYYRRGVLLDHIADSVGLRDDDHFVMADRVRREFGSKPPLWP